MAVNSAFKTSGLAASTGEQDLYSNLIRESIQIHGHDVNYIDRTIQARDDIFGEDSLSQFNKQQTIEMYVEDAEGGYQGEKELIQQTIVKVDPKDDNDLLKGAPPCLVSLLTDGITEGGRNEMMYNVLL